MTDSMHKFKIGQTVDLITSTARSAASGRYEIISLRPTAGVGAGERSRPRLLHARGGARRGEKAPENIQCVRP